MNIQPTLTGKRLLLRPLTAADYQGLLDAASDPLIWEQHPQPTRYQPEVFAQFFGEALDSKGALVIIDRRTGTIIGSSRYYEFDREASTVVIGYTFLARKYWGGIYNRELKQLMVNYALKFVRATLFQVGVHNLRSQKAMEKLGATNTGVQEIAVSYAPPKKSYIYKIETPFPDDRVP